MRTRAEIEAAFPGLTIKSVSYYPDDGDICDVDFYAPWEDPEAYDMDEDGECPMRYYIDVSDSTAATALTVGLDAALQSGDAESNA